MVTLKEKGAIGPVSREETSRVFGTQIRFALRTAGAAYQTHRAARVKRKSRILTAAANLKPKTGDRAVRVERKSRILTAAANLKPKTGESMSLFKRLFANFYPATKRKSTLSATIEPKTKQKS